MSKLIKVFRNNLYMIGIIWKNSRSYIPIFFVHILVSYCRDILLVIAPKFIFDSMEAGNNLSDIIISVAFYSSMYFLLHFICYALEYTKSVLEAKLKLKLNISIGKKFMKLDYLSLEKNQSIDMFNKAKMAISGGLDDIQTMGMACEQGITGYFDQISLIIKDVLVIASVIYVFSYTKWYILVLLLICVGINLCASVNKTYAAVNIRKDAGPYLTKSRYCNGILRRFEYGKEFRIFDMSDFVIDKFDKCTEDYLQVRDKYKNRNCFSIVIASLSNGIMRAVVLIYLVISLKDGIITVGDFSMIFAAVLSFSENMSDLLKAIISLNVFSEFMMDYQKCMNMEEAEGIGDRVLETKGNHVIEFKDVWFKYPNSEKYAIKGLNIKMSGNKKISVVGFNGAGKSTFIKLLLGLYRPEKGEILIDDININELSADNLYSVMSAVFQDYAIFALRIDENIALQNNINTEFLENSMKKSGIFEKVNSLDKKEASVIGGFFDDGDLMLSGGESQKIAMSRSFYRNTSCILLDEPTSALDVFSEDKMYTSVAENVKEELVLFISHRLASTKFCDEILVFKEGNIVETGTHSELLEKNGIYAQMWAVQAEKFRKEAAAIEN